LSAGIPDAWALAAEAYANKGETDKTTRCINTLKTAPVEAFQLRHRLYRLERVRRAQSLQ
jgi:hypothetical protein